MYAARRPRPSYSGKGKQAASLNSIGESSRSVSPTTRLGSTLLFTPRSNPSLDSSAVGTLGTMQSVTSRERNSTAATSLDVEDYGSTPADRVDDKHERHKEDGEEEDGEEEEEEWFYDKENILAWL